MWSTWLEAKESCQTIKFASTSQERPSHEMLTKFSVWKNEKCFTKFFTHIIYTPITHELKGVFFREKTLAKHLRVKGCHTHNHLHILSWFSSTPTSPSLHPLEVLSPNTSSSVETCFVPLGSIRRSNWVAVAIGLNCRIQEASEDKTSRNPLVVGAWRAQLHWLD